MLERAVASQMNPQHAIPVLKDGDYVLSESRAIAVYVVEKYGKRGAGASLNLLESDNPELNAKIHQLMHFDAGVFWPAVQVRVQSSAQERKRLTSRSIAFRSSSPPTFSRPALPARTSSTR